MKNLFLLITFIAFGLTTRGQEYTNVVSLHVVPLAVGEVRLGYERAIADNYSVLLNGGYFIQHKIPKFIYTEEALANNGISIESNNSMVGFDIVPELRRYFGSGNAPNGFYVGVYAKYAQYDFEMMDVINYEFSETEIPDLDPDVQAQLDENSSLDINVQLDANLNQYGGGLQLGYQFAIGKRWNIDFLILGLEINRTDLDAELVSPTIPVDYSSWVDETQAASDEWDRWPFVEDLEFEAIENGIRVSAEGLMPWYRGGIKIGFSF